MLEMIIYKKVISAESHVNLTCEFIFIREYLYCRKFCWSLMYKSVYLC